MLGLYSPNLQTIKVLRGVDKINESCIKLLFSGCRKIKCIFISKPYDKPPVVLPSGTMSFISMYCKELEILKLYNIEQIYTDSITCLSQLTNLRILDLDLVRTELLFPIDVFVSNSKLETVNLNGDLYHDTIMRGLGAHCHLLKHVSLTSWAWRVVTDEGIIAMVQGCPLLESIEMHTFIIIIIIGR